MHYTILYHSPLGDMTLAGNEHALTGAWFNGQKYYALGLSPDSQEQQTPVLKEAARWLDLYFAGTRPDFMPPLVPQGSVFRQQVWGILQTIPYGQTMTYGQIAALLAQQNGKERMSAQAVGGAVGHNPLSLFIPCHRVMGANNSLTGYAGGIDKKLALLKLEGIDTSHFTIPTKGTAL